MSSFRLTDQRLHFYVGERLSRFTEILRITSEKERKRIIDLNEYRREGRLRPGLPDRLQPNNQQTLWDPLPNFPNDIPPYPTPWPSYGLGTAIPPVRQPELPQWGPGGAPQPPAPPPPPAAPPAATLEQKIAQEQPVQENEKPVQPPETQYTVPLPTYGNSTILDKPEHGFTPAESVPPFKHRLYEEELMLRDDIKRELDELLSRLMTMEQVGDYAAQGMRTILENLSTVERVSMQNLNFLWDFVVREWETSPHGIGTEEYLEIYDQVFQPVASFMLDLMHSAYIVSNDALPHYLLYYEMKLARAINEGALDSLMKISEWGNHIQSKVRVSDYVNPFFDTARQLADRMISVSNRAITSLSKWYRDYVDHNIDGKSRREAEYLLEAQRRAHGIATGMGTQLDLIGVDKRQMSGLDFSEFRQKQSKPRPTQPRPPMSQLKHDLKMRDPHYFWHHHYKLEQDLKHYQNQWEAEKKARDQELEDILERFVPQQSPDLSQTFNQIFIDNYLKALEKIAEMNTYDPLSGGYVQGPASSNLIIDTMAKLLGVQMQAALIQYVGGVHAFHQLVQTINLSGNNVRAIQQALNAIPQQV